MARPRITSSHHRRSASIRDGATERDCAARYLHSWAIALRGREWSGERVVDKLFALAQDIRSGAHVVDPDGDSPAPVGVVASEAVPPDMVGLFVDGKLVAAGRVKPGGGG